MDAYERLLSILDSGGARYRIIEHPAEGRTEVVSGYRGNNIAHAAKCLVVIGGQEARPTGPRRWPAA